MSEQREVRALPKFGEWDVNDPASADGFTVIFSKARDEKKTGLSGGNVNNNAQKQTTKNVEPKNSSKRKWFCFA